MRKVSFYMHMSRFSQVFKYQCDLLGREHPLVGAVIRFGQSLGKLGVQLNPLCQSVQGGSRADVGCIRLCQFTLIIRSDTVVHFEL